MEVKIKRPELKCMEPANYRKYFRVLCWSGTRRTDKKQQKKYNKKDKFKRWRSSNALVVCYAPALLGNPSQFAVYATVRRSILARCRQIQASAIDISEDSENDELPAVSSVTKLSKITGIGLRTVFALISQARLTDPQFCEQSLKALLDVLQGHAPEELSHEPSEIISNLHAMLMEVSCGSQTLRVDIPSNLTALSSSCLLALSVARGEAELILNAVASLIMSSTSLADQYVQIPMNLTVLQRSVQAVVLGAPARNLWLNFGVPDKSLFTQYRVQLPDQLLAGPNELVVRSLVSDGCFLYLFTSKGLLKIGSGYGSSMRQEVYAYKSDFFASDRHGWLGYCKDKMYVRIGRKKTEVYEVDKDSLEVRCVIRLDPGLPAPIEPKSAVFSDGNQLGLILLTNFDNLTIKMYDVESYPAERSEGGTHTLSSRREINVHLLRRRTLVLGRAPFEDNLSRRMMDLDTPVAMQLDDNEDDPLLGISAGQDFGLLTTSTGKVYYTGKGTSLGYKVLSPQTGKWTLMKETLFFKNEAPNTRKHKVIQVAVGHEGVHAILVLENGSALFTGIARRGEDGDANRHRRSPKPTRPKKIVKADGHHVVYAACNYGSTALVTRQGQLLMFGKDTQHCDSTGLIAGIRHERVTQVALGKAHAVALTSHGQVYTFGINNKGQCGREFGYTKEKPYSRRHSEREEVRTCVGPHTWAIDYCRVCVLCRECTGFSSACHCASLPNRIPGENCGCGEGDSGCIVCGVCRRCGEASTSSAGLERPELDDDASAADNTSDKENARYTLFEAHSSTTDMDREGSSKVSCLPPARVAVPGGHRVVAIACGLHHTVLLTEHGEVLTFGSNQYGALGAGDIAAHHRIVRVRVPRASAIAAGSNHTAILTKEGELYTFGSYQKGSLGRPRSDEPRTDRSPIWYATPGRVPRLGPRYTCKAVWVSASGDQTFVQVSQSLIKTDTLFSSTITANSKSIVILPNRPEHTFKCITINRNDGSCNAWTGPEQVNFVNTLACLDPLYDVLWCYKPKVQMLECFNILAFDSHKLQRCCSNDLEAFSDTENEYPSYGCMKRLEDFRHLENFEWVNNRDDGVSDIPQRTLSVLKKDLAIPCIPGCSVTRIHAALHLLGCLDSLAYAHDNKLSQVDCKRDYNVLPAAPPKDEFLTVNRFEGNGGGWGYSGHSIEAIRFMCDSDILIGGYGLFGGRGDYSAKIKLFDIGMDGGDLEIDGELVGESDDFVFECAPKDKFPILFDNPLPVMSCRWYVAWACINGPSSDCGSAGQAMVINDDIGFHFKTSKRSNNGTDVNAGQIPCLLYKIATDDLVAPIRHLDPGEPVIALTKNISRKITLSCFCSLITLSQWSWKRFKIILLDTNGQVPTSHQKLTVMKWQKRLVYIIRLCLRLIKSYINEVFPENSKKKKSHDYMCYFEAIADIRNFLQEVLSFQTPNCNMLPRRRRSGYPVCYVQFALDLTKSILVEANETIVACFYAFFPTPVLKWSHLCFLLHHVKDGVVPASHIRELASTCAALCFSQSLRDVLQYIVPVTQSKISVIDCRRPESKVIKEVPCRSATVPRASHSQKPPPIPPRANNRDVQRIQDTGDSSSYLVWHLLDVVPKLLDVVLIPIKKQIMMHPCEDLHEHGETEQQERVVDFSCKLVARLVAEMSFNAVHIREDSESKNLKHLITPSRFMRVNLTRSWNTGNGSPDAICFTVDRPGVVLVGACIYGGVGSYEYTLELLHDLRSTAEEMNPPHSWISVEAVRGTFTSADCQHDMMQIKFEQPVILKENLRYAFRLCNQGGRTTNGDCGLPSVKGPDGTTFNFSSCSLSFNGTTLARGQLPCIIYYSAKEQVVGSKLLIQATETADSLVIALREVTLRVAALIVDRSVELFCALRSEITTEDLRNYGFILQQSPVINTLLPHVLANLEGLDDSKSVVQLLEMVRKLLPQVAAMNLLMPTSDAPDPNITATSQYYTWVESEHPYKQATVSNMRVLFPPQVCWVVLEMDPRSITAQSEDSLTIYAVAGAPKHRCHCSSESADSDPPFRKRLIQLTSETGEAEELDEPAPDAPCMQYNCTYVSVTPKLSNVHADWPRKALLVPGNEVIFSLETASDYLSEYSKSVNDENRYGYRCLCIGYERAPTSTSVEGLLALEMELVHMGAACASRLLAPDLDIPPLTFATILEVQALAMSMGAASSNGEEGASAAREMDGGDESESLLLTRGLHLSSPPTVQHVLEGLPLLRCISTERQFLADFVAGAESTAGGRLARWLAPAPRVEPAKCEMRPPPTPVRPATLLSLPIIIRDQYGDIVASPALKVEMVVQRQEDGNSKLGQTSSTECQGILPDVPYQPSLRDTMCFHAITMMKAYQNYSFEELRLYSGLWGEARAGAAGSGRVPVERVAVHAHADGTYVANWLPIVAGTYIFRCILDDQPTPQELVVVVMESNEEEPVERLQSSQASAAPANVMRFAASCSAGLRVRASTSLQAEEIGCVPPGAYISFVDEIRYCLSLGRWFFLFVFQTLPWKKSLACVSVNLVLSYFVIGKCCCPWSGCKWFKHLSSQSQPSPARGAPADQRRGLRRNLSISRAPCESSSGEKSTTTVPVSVTLINKDGTWLRLSTESVQAYAEGSAGVAWCLMFHRHLKKPLLLPVDYDDSPQEDDAGSLSTYNEAKADVSLWPQDDDADASNDMSADDRRFPFSIQCDLANESDSSPSPFNQYAEPSKRGRFIRDESNPARRLPRRSNGNRDEWSPVKHRPGDNVQDANVLETEIIESEVESRASRLAQTGTQTSPEGETAVGAQLSVDLNKEEDSSPKRAVRDRVSRPKCMSTSSSTPPPLPARANPPSYTPKKHALSPAQGECVRGIFAALLWHEGIVHDAIACAAFLKFHPQLPKAGARVVTRPSAHDVPLPRHQRHSVEVSNAGQYLHIHASTLETLTRSGNEASSSRARKTDINVSIREEDSSHTSETATTPSVVNVLPPALRALVALWDALYDADQLVVATDKLKKEPMENNENEDTRPVSGIRKKKDSKYSKTPYSVRCELCGSASVPPPLAAHMRHMHPGCRAPTAHGYDRAGAYKLADPSPSASNAPTSVCGQLAQDLIGVKIRATLAAYQLWYIYCENCREKAMKASTSTTTKQKTVTMTEAYERVERVEPDVDHLTMRDNAVFLLDLAPLTTTESINASPWHEVAGRSPPSPPGSVWQPAPSFQSLPAFGAGPKTHAPDTARYHSLGRQLPSTSKGGTYAQTNTVGVQFPRVHRSISMGQASERDLAHAARPQRMRFEPDTYDTLSGAGATLLTQPSAALQKLVGCGDWTSESCSVSAFEPPTIDTDSLMRSPVLSFILAKRDLPAYRQKMDAAVRINTVRQYAFEALNWLLRSTTLPTSVHDVMWWFCNALDKYARLAPPVPSFEDNKENEASRAAVPTASVSAICPGGRSARGARAAFHAFLGSVSALAPSLPPASAISLQAVRCWALHYSQHDRAFLHRSQVFSVISKILSHAEDGVYDEGLLGALRESFHSYANKQNFVWSCPDVTGWCDVSVSSRPGMAGALTDGSTETFWESGDDDRNKAKWVEVSYPSGSQDDRPQVVCVHIDNTRDTAAKTALLSFLFSGGTSEMFHMTDLEVDPKTATWVCYTLPRTTSASLRVRCELHGPDPTSRVRQVQVLGAPVAVLDAPQQAHALHSLAERDTLRVFRLLTSQVFGKLLEWEQGGSESGDGAAAEEAAGDDSDLREHVVGILFAGHKLTSLQRQVMSHIVCAIGCEAARVRDDWETALLCAEAEKARAVEDTPPRPTHQQDNYCFEMLSLLLALSGSVVGRAQLAQRTELLIDLMTLLHTGSERVQRQVISLLRRMIAEIPPQKMTAALNYGSDESTRLTLLDHLVSYLGKAITVQVKVKGAGSASPGNVTLGSSVTPTPPAAWFMRGETTKKHSHLVAKMITDMAEDKVSLEWGAETRNAIAQYVSAVAQVEEAERRPPRCVSSPTVWLALSALCVCEPEYAEAIIGASESRENRREGAEASVHCVNHDDGSTLAVIECRTCGFLCAECDRFLHLNRAARTHYRQVCKEEESAIRIDIHEGCGRAKLFWLLLLVDRRTLKALVEFRGMDSGACETGEITTCVASSLTGICRFCGTRGNSGLLAIGNVCADNQCQEHGRDACARVLGCGHLCGGVRGERTCLPCLFGCAAPDSLRQDADDMCMICFTDPLQAAPAIQLSCGHVFHLHCCKKVLANKWIGPRITFSFSQCPICKEDMTHWTLEDLLAPIRQLGEEVKRKALMRLEYEGMGSSNRARSTMDLATYAMERYAYYVCHKCGKAYFGGLARCEAESNGSWEPAELVCGACSDVAGARICPKHGADFLEYKCRYCCSVAVFFCFGTSHFCNACHDDFQRVTNIPRHLLPQCPAGPKGEQLPGSSEMCPLHVQHPSTGEEFALGCGVCRHHSHAF